MAESIHSHRIMKYVISIILLGCGLFARSLTAGQSGYSTRVMKKSDIDKLKNLFGVAEKGRNYNLIINGHGTGLKPPTEDEWESMKEETVIVDHVEISAPPPSYDNAMTIWFPPIGDQQLEGSCASFSAGYYIKTFQEAKEHNWDLSSCIWQGSDEPTPAYQDFIFSPDFIYHQINDGVDLGSTFEDNFKLIYYLGICSWEKMPYDDYDHTSWPNEAAWRQSPLYRTESDEKFLYVDTDNGILALKQFLYDGNLVSIGVDASQYDKFGAADLWTLDNYSDDPINHANTVVGYDDNFGPYTENGNPLTYGAFKVANQWGVGGWENTADGFLYISYACMKNRIGAVRYCDDAIDYNPELVAVFKLTHPFRGECRVTVGLNEIAHPQALKRFDDFYSNGGAYPYPNNKMVMDISEFIPQLSTFSNTFFLSVYDGGTTLTGSIDFFSLEKYDDYLSGLPISIAYADDVPMNTEIENTVYSELIDSKKLIIRPDEVFLSWESGIFTFEVEGHSLNPLDWTASVTDGGSWLTILSGFSGSGDGSIQIQVTEHTDMLNDRVGTIRIDSPEAENAPILIPVTQSRAIYLVDPDPASLDMTCYEEDVDIDLNIAGPDTLSWTTSITQGATWIHVTDGAAGQGDGNISVHIDPNADPAAGRTGNIRIICNSAENSPVDIPVTQSEASYDISVYPASVSIPWQTGDSTLQVSITGPVPVNWTTYVQSGASWLSILSGTSGTDNGQVVIHFNDNMDPDLSRAGMLRLLCAAPVNTVIDVSVSQNHWLEFQRITTGQIVTDVHFSQGLCWSDYDNDGDQDVFVANGNEVNQRSNILYVNQGDGTFYKVVMGSGNSYAGSWGDYNNDGYLDLYVTNYGTNCLYRNNGNGTFTQIVEGILVEETGSSRGCSWADYDRDGYIDLFVVNADNQSNALYHNNGDGSFSKIITGAPVTDNNDSRGCAWADYDNDGYPDLFVANHSGQNNCLYHNNQDGTFTKINTGSIVTNGGESQGCSWDDYNNDGYLDVFITNRKNQRNFLFKNNGDGTFLDIGSGPVVSDQGSSYGSCWGDYDLDGNLDLFVANRPRQNNFLYLNDGDGSFTKATEEEVVTNSGSSFGCGWGDIEMDGDLDLYVANYDENNFLYTKNARDNHWIQIHSVGKVSNKAAIGARIRIKATIAGTPKWQIREISGQTGYLSQNSLTAEFGLGDATVVDSIQILWPSTITWDTTHVSADQILTITEQANVPIAVDDTLSILEGTSALVYPLSNDSDADGDELVMYALNTSAIHGSASINAGDTSVTYIPLKGFAGTDTITYFITDGKGGNAQAHIIITVNAIPNQPPVAVNDTAQTIQDIPVVIAILDNDSDPDGDLIFVKKLITTGLSGAVTLQDDETVYYIPPDGFTGSDAFRYSIGDGRGGLDTAHVAVTVNRKANYPPTAYDDTSSVRTSDPVILDLLANDTDPDNDALHILSLFTQVTNGYVEINKGDTTVTYTARKDFKGLDTFRYTIGDGKGEMDTAFVILDVNIASEEDTVTYVDGRNLPQHFLLAQNFPNPFNPRTEIHYQLPRSEQVSIVVFNILGAQVRELINRKQSAGYFFVTWDATDENGAHVPSGIYFIRMRAGDYSMIRKMMFIQ